jgi:hypothetical protein
MVGVQHFVMKQVSPGINVGSTEVRKITPPTKQTPPPLSSTVGTSSASVPTRSSSSLQPIKKKQTSLDNLFPKKRKFAEESEDEDVPQKTPFPKKHLGSSLVSEHPHSRSQTSCFPNDIANYVNVNSLTDEQKYNVLCNVWVPSTKIRSSARPCFVRQTSRLELLVQASGDISVKQRKSRIEFLLYFLWTAKIAHKLPTSGKGYNSCKDRTQ